MSEGAAYEVRLSRWLLLMLIAVGLLFVWVGLEIGFLHMVFDVLEERLILRWLFVVFCIGIGGLIAVTQTLYLLAPPVMMRISADGVCFGTGLRYHPYRIPLKYLKSVDVFKTESMVEVDGKRKIVEGGVELQFERTSDIPASMAASAGIMYSGHCLRLRKGYMSRRTDDVVAAVRRFL